MSIAALVRRMGELGASAELIALAVEEVEAVQLSLDARRVADRDRKRDQRERERLANVTGQSEDSLGTVTPISAAQVSLDKKAPQTPEKIKPIPCVREPRARGWHRLPEGWRPTRNFPPQLQTKIDLWPPGTLDDEIASLKRWAANAEDKNGKGRKLDWDKALWNWLGRRHDERHGRTNGMGRNQPSDGLSSTARAALRVFGTGERSGVSQ